MIHIGNEEYYREISGLVSGLHSVLVEGVSLNTKELGTYRNLAEGLNLQTQEAVIIPDDLPVHNIDLDPDEFETEIRKLPISDKMAIKKIDFALRKNWKNRKEEIVELLVKHFSYPEESRHHLKNPENHVALKHKNKTKKELLFENKRNDCFQRELNTYIDANIERPFVFTCGILLGDAHMPYIYEVLKERDFHWSLYKEVIAITFQVSSPNSC